MSDQHATGRHLLETGERFIVRAFAVVLGTVMMVSGLGMGVTVVLLPIGLPLGVIGLLLALWGLFYATPVAAPPAGAAGQGHGHETGGSS
jgi:uncharacterized oligopeptide transporter (OPT) family protein